MYNNSNSGSVCFRGPGPDCVDRKVYEGFPVCVSNSRSCYALLATYCCMVAHIASFLDSSLAPIESGERLAQRGSTLWSLHFSGMEGSICLLHLQDPFVMGHPSHARGDQSSNAASWKCNPWTDTQLWCYFIIGSFLIYGVCSSALSVCLQHQGHCCII